MKTIVYISHHTKYLKYPMTHCSSQSLASLHFPGSSCIFLHRSFLCKSIMYRSYLNTASPLLLKSCVTSPNALSGSNGNSIIGIYSPEKAMCIINIFFLITIFFLFFSFAGIPSSKFRQKKSLCKGAKLVQMVTGWSLNCIKFILPRDKF